jgi:predicted phage terminase large subunit-like protein
MNLNKAAYNLFKREVAKRDFWQFCLYYDEKFFTDRAFLKEIAIAFQKIEMGEMKSLSVSMPPRAGKSYITSLFCAWTLGRNPTESVMRNTCTATLYAKFSYDVRAIVRSEKFMEVFRNVRISEDKGNLMGWNTTQSKQVGYFGAGVGGTIIGFGASKLAITDDLYSGLESALSETLNEKIIMWKEGTHDSRFESGCARIDIGTRWSINDMIGRNIGNGIYEQSIVVAALTEDDKSFCESVMTTDEYLEKRKRTEESIWLAEYQQTPVDIKGRLFNDLRYTDLLPDEFDGYIGYVDVADMGKDYTACAILGKSGNEMYVVDYIYNRENTDTTIPLVANLLNKYNVSYCRVESNNMGAMFARYLQKETPSTRILQVANTSNKMTRILMQSVFIMQRMIFYRNETKDCEQFIAAVLSYSKEGGNKNDDAPDCLAGLSIFAQSMFRDIV